jgi:PEGA domain-containing protein
MKSRAAFAITALALSGCGLLTQGTSQRVKFESHPPKAEIWINGQKQPELTPTTIELPRGELSYQIKMKGYDTVANKLTTRTSSTFYWSLLMGVIAGGLDWLTGAWQEFDIPEEDKDTIKVALERSIDNSDQIVAISSNPPGATITIGGIFLQEKTGILGRGTRVEVKWANPKDQERTVELKLTGYLPASLKLRRGEKTLHMNMEQQPITQSLLFDSDPQEAEVLIDGVVSGKTPCTTLHERRLGDDRERKIEIRKAGYESKFETIKDKSSKTITVKLIEKLETLAVKVDCVPAGSSLEVDGKPAGEAPSEVRLTWSESLKSHKLRISRPGYESREIVIDVTKKSEPVVVRLKPSLPDFP